jgi:hypothetical protein
MTGDATRMRTTTTTTTTMTTARMAKTTATGMGLESAMEAFGAPPFFLSFIYLFIYF